MIGQLIEKNPNDTSVSDFVNNEIDRKIKLYDPYNSPVLVEPKKGQNEDGTLKHKIVIDYKKLNENTIPDRYPKQDPSIILLHTTVDLQVNRRVLIELRIKSLDFSEVNSI